MNDYVIIVAGGKGLRMGSDVPKQFLPVGGQPVLMRTMERFREYAVTLRIILVLPQAQQDYWRELCSKYGFKMDYLLADGGETRFHSVKNGLAMIPDDAHGVVGIHDGVRPFPSVEVIARCYETARTAAAVVPVVPVVETIRHIVSAGGAGGAGETDISGCPGGFGISGFSGGSALSTTSSTVPRDQYRLVQTPQAFDIQLLKAAYRQPYCEDFTDDASVVEAFGFNITLVDGNRENIKITTPYDLKIAEVLV